MRGLRTIPVFLDICRDMEELCPDVMFLQYVNPMAMNTWAINRASKIKTVGLCHSVQGTAEALAEDIGVPYNEINYICAGINHMAFYLRFERNGEDLYPQLRKVAEAKSYGRRYREPCLITCVMKSFAARDISSQSRASILANMFHGSSNTTALT